MRAALRVAPAITVLQISQFAWGTVINAIAAVAYASPDIGCQIQPPILYIGAALYLVYGALFVQLFVHRYLRRTPASAHACDGPPRNGHEFPENGVVSNGDARLHALSKAV